jgi:AAA family ATP:ADP antiporter
MENSSESTGIAYKVLRLFTVIHPGEATTAILLTFNIYLLLLAYYIIKPVREALIIGGQGADIKSYLSAAIAVLLIFFVKASCLSWTSLLRSWVLSFLSGLGYSM